MRKTGVLTRDERLALMELHGRLLEMAKCVQGVLMVKDIHDENDTHRNSWWRDYLKCAVDDFRSITYAFAKFMNWDSVLWEDNGPVVKMFREIEQLERIQDKQAVPLPPKKDQSRCTVAKYLSGELSL